MLQKEPHIYESGLLRMDLDDRDEPIYALNEMRIENVIKSQSVDVYIDDEFFRNMSWIRNMFINAGRLYCIQSGTWWGSD